MTTPKQLHDRIKEIENRKSLSTEEKRKLLQQLRKDLLNALELFYNLEMYAGDLQNITDEVEMLLVKARTQEVKNERK